MSNTAPKPSRASQQRKRQTTSPLKYIGYGPEQDRAALLERLPDAFMSVDPDWQVTYLNQHAEALLGTTREALLGRNIWEVFPFLIGSFLSLKAHEAMNKQSSLEYSQYHPLLNTWFSVWLYPFQDGLYGFCQNITQQKQAQEQSVGDASKSIIVTNLQRKIIYWNEGASLLFGYSAEEMLGKTPALLYPERWKHQLAHDVAHIRDGNDSTGVWKGRRKDGALVDLRMETTVLRNTEGKAIGYISVVQDRIERTPAEEQFLYYARLAQSHLDAVIATDTDYNILSWNEAAERLYGWKQEEVLGKFVNEIIPTTFFATTGSQASEQLQSKGYWKGEVRQKRKDGTALPILASVSVVKDGAGKIIGAVAANRDLSELTYTVTAIEMDDQLL